jgi:hypothetical protein
MTTREDDFTAQWSFVYIRCYDFSKVVTSVELCLSASLALMSLVGSIIILHKMRLVEHARKLPSAQVKLVQWVAGTAVLWSFASCLLHTSLFVDRPFDRCSVIEWSNFQFALLFFVEAGRVACSGYSLLLGWSLCRYAYFWRISREVVPSHGASLFVSSTGVLMESLIPLSRGMSSMVNELNTFDQSLLPGSGKNFDPAFHLIPWGMAFLTFLTAMMPLSYDYETFGPIDTFLRDRGLVNTAESVVNAATFTSVIFTMYSFRRGGDIPEVLVNSWKLLFRLIAADLIINLPFIILNFSLIYTDRPNPLLFSISMPLLQAQGIAIYCTYALNQAALQRMFFFCWVDSLRAPVILSNSSKSHSDSSSTSKGSFDEGIYSNSTSRITEASSDNLLQSLIRSFEYDDRPSIDGFEEGGWAKEPSIYSQAKSRSKSRSRSRQSSFFEESIVRKFQCKINASQIEFAEQIGRGSSACVKRGKFGNTDVAIKVYNAPYLRDMRRSQEFEKEVAVLLTVFHPNILRFYGIVEIEGNRLGLVTELCSESLRHQIQSLQHRQISFQAVSSTVQIKFDIRNIYGCF